MSDASEPPLCDTLGCENTPVEAGYCEECTGISPGVLDQDWGEESHQGSAGSLMSATWVPMFPSRAMVP